jgi:hypothetical protein
MKKDDEDRTSDDKNQAEPNHKIVTNLILFSCQENNDQKNHYSPFPLFASEGSQMPVVPQ